MRYIALSWLSHLLPAIPTTLPPQRQVEQLTPPDVLWGLRQMLPTLLATCESRGPLVLSCVRPSWAQVSETEREDLEESEKIQYWVERLCQTRLEQISSAENELSEVTAPFSPRGPSWGRREA